ncbi:MULTISPECIES: Lrp/AsnC family transcriptional regulator [Tistrella]|mgnify:CR=1 FL=1|jgi:DNA-binding Lrp family transcriptional regulator|uniref:Alanine catabolic operon transcriptional regulator protein n=1 Tax=Tistrella mobilis (strain KA081020-065) TaxID=1110502 RepID=I3TKN7_TISMK|nr:MULTISPECIES: Lrp/AsnC family transcriptional regulator [Tistrella]AFK53325.1 alanine catabolic operon transcriptional regulator protein [Tistrella mobilis KA081020-065]|tara:strand:+ start:142 stop:609 length:468 start_codon:yes stop_codon:yes gene_type:complete
MPIKLDEIDKRILRALQRDGRMQNVELAREVGLSPSPCLRRVRLLEEAGIIRRYAAVVDPAKIGLPLSLFARIWLEAQDAETIDRFIAAVREFPEVVECYIMLGDCDALLRVVAADLDDYRRFQANHLSRVKGVRNIKTDVPSQTVKQSVALPLR